MPRRFNLPDELAARLRGATVQELEADAKVLQKFAVAPSTPAALSGGLDPADDSDTEADPRALARKYGSRRRLSHSLYLPSASLAGALAAANLVTTSITPSCPAAVT
ncbi:hypothetical protein [Actinoplanes sp. NPDC049681]|uniref:hypothetical protein n=1 Tax=Actinoplanes sp. NPDC049681 TaxID=3363905 RepID=UPI0037ACADBB